MNGRLIDIWPLLLALFMPVVRRNVPALGFV